MRRLALLALLIAGCADTDPSTSQLQPGQRVLIPRSDTPSGRRMAEIRGENGYPIDDRSPAGKWPYLNTGDEAIVIQDPGKDPDDNHTTARSERWIAIQVTRRVSEFSDRIQPGLKCQARRLDLRVVPEP